MKLHIHPARQGLIWVKQGVRTFFRQPLALSGLFFIFMALMSLLSLVPVLGNALALALLPAATLGLMAATQVVTQGEFPKPMVLLSGFRAGRKELRSMLVLGVHHAVACCSCWRPVRWSMAASSPSSISWVAAWMWTWCRTPDSNRPPCWQWRSICPCLCFSGMPRPWCTGMGCRPSKACFSARWPAHAIWAHTWCTAWCGLSCFGCEHRRGTASHADWRRGKRRCCLVPLRPGDGSHVFHIHLFHLRRQLRRRHGRASLDAPGTFPTNALTGSAIGFMGTQQKRPHRGLFCSRSPDATSARRKDVR